MKTTYWSLTVIGSKEVILMEIFISDWLLLSPDNTCRILLTWVFFSTFQFSRQQSDSIESRTVYMVFYKKDIP